MRAILLLVLLSGCAAFDAPPDSLCISGYCAYLQRDIDRLNSRETTKSLCAAGAITVACRQRGLRGA